MDGRVKVEGCAVTYLPLYPEEIFFRAFRYQEFDVSELSFWSYLRTVASGTSAYMAIPAFVSRIFRHSGIYIRRDAGIKTPADLRGKRIGLPGIPDHRRGVDARHAAARIRRRADGDPLAQRRPGGARAQRAHAAQADPGPRSRADSARPRPWSACCATANSMRCSRPAPPSSFLRGEPHIARLFPDTRAAEIAYFKKTGLFPIMHLIGIRKTLLAQYPWLATSLYKAFCEAKALAMTDLRDVNALMVTLPFLEAETLDTMAAMGNDFWRYGVHENKGEIEALTGYAFEQGLIDRKPTAEELFAAVDVRIVEGVSGAHPCNVIPGRANGASPESVATGGDTK